MRVIGVLDLLGGRAVHARAGRRERYAPVRESAGVPIEAGDALALAHTYKSLGIDELYAADLDAIVTAGLKTGHQASFGLPLASLPPSPRLRRASPKLRAGGKIGPTVVKPDRVFTSHDTLVTALAALGAPVWLDAGVSSVEHAQHSLTLGAARVIVGLETLRSYDALRQICDAVGGHRVAFSLDLRHGEPIASGRELPAREPAHVVAARAADAGAGAVIVLDLARVGTGVGLDFDLIDRVRAAAPTVTLLAGGGIRGLEDLIRLAEGGCDGALVATALHDGRLGHAEVKAARLLEPRLPSA